MTVIPTLARNGVATALVACLTIPSGCMALSPQLAPTDFAALEQLEDRDAREKAYAENAVYRHRQAQGIRYTKGTNPNAEKRSWQSLDAVLRSDASASEKLPARKLRIARIFTAISFMAGIVTVAGIAASAREGLDLNDIDGTGALLFGGGLVTVAAAITAGIVYSRAKPDYDRAVDIYNDSLGVRLGLYTPDGKYIAPRGSLVDKDGYIILDQPEDAAEAETEEKLPAEHGPTPPPADTEATPPPAETAPPPAEPAPPVEVAPPPAAAGGLLQMRR